MNTIPETVAGKKSLKFTFIIISLALLLLILLYYIEILSFKILHLIFYFDFLSLFIFLIIHVVLIRYTVLIFLFPGSNFLLKRLLRYENGKFQANQIIKIITLFKSNMEMLTSTSQFSLRSLNIRVMMTSKNKFNI
jgi:hypothetical protein